MFYLQDKNPRSLLDSRNERKRETVNLGPFFLPPSQEGAGA